MPSLIRGNQVVSDDWQIVQDTPSNPDAARMIVPAKYAIAHAEALFSEGREVGVWFAGDAELDEIIELLDRISIVAIDFPAFNDGRGLSLAVLLRTRFGFRRELRAIGDVHTDMLHYLHRCGFDSYLLPDGRDPQTALAALNSLTGFYQGSVLEPMPSYRRVARGRAAA